MTCSESRRRSSLAEVDQLQCAPDLAETDAADSEAREQVAVKAKRSYADAFPEELSTSNSSNEDANDINSCPRDADPMEATRPKIHSLLTRIFDTQVRDLSIAMYDMAWCFVVCGSQAIIFQRALSLSYVSDECFPLLVVRLQSPLSLAIVESGQAKGFVVNKQYMDQMAKIYHENMILRAEVSNIRKSLANSS